MPRKGPQAVRRSSPDSLAGGTGTVEYPLATEKCSRGGLAVSSENVEGPYDVGSIANLLLDEADRLGFEITNLVLQKMLYFAHGQSLARDRLPLVSGYFVAWRYGPIHAAGYELFKQAGGSPITFRAEGLDLLTGEPRQLPPVEDQRAQRVVSHVVLAYGGVPVPVLVDISHAKGGPWDYIVEKSKSVVVVGMRIPDDVIAERFHRQLVRVSADPRQELYDDFPFASNGAGPERGPFRR